MAVKHVLRGSVFLLLIYMILRDLSDPCLGLQPNNDYASTDLAVGQEVTAFSFPKFSLKKSYLRNKCHFGLRRFGPVCQSNKRCPSHYSTATMQ